MAKAKSKVNRLAVGAAVAGMAAAGVAAAVVLSDEDRRKKIVKKLTDLRDTAEEVLSQVQDFAETKGGELQETGKNVKAVLESSVEAGKKTADKISKETKKSVK